MWVVASIPRCLASCSIAVLVWHTAALLLPATIVLLLPAAVSVGVLTLLPLFCNLIDGLIILRQPPSLPFELLLRLSLIMLLLLLRWRRSIVFASLDENSCWCLWAPVAVDGASVLVLSLVYVSAYRWAEAVSSLMRLMRASRMSPEARRRIKNADEKGKSSNCWEQKKRRGYKKKTKKYLNIFISIFYHLSIAKSINWSGIYHPKPRFSLVP